MNQISDLNPELGRRDNIFKTYISDAYNRVRLHSTHGMRLSLFIGVEFNILICL